MWESLCHGWSFLAWLLFLLTSACTPIAQKAVAVLRPPLIPGRDPVDETDLTTRNSVISRLAAVFVVGLSYASGLWVSQAVPAQSRGQPQTQRAPALTVPAPEEVKQRLETRTIKV